MKRHFALAAGTLSVGLVALGGAFAQDEPEIAPAAMYGELRDEGGEPAELGWPDGPGRDRTIQICSNCHGMTPIRPVAFARLWPGQWSFMLGQGMDEYEEPIYEEVMYYLQNYLAADVEAPPPGTPGPWQMAEE